MSKQLLINHFYEKYLSNKKTDEVIPKKIHQVWLGEIPSKVKELSLKIQNLHPNWEYKLWTYDDVTNFNMKNINLFNNLNNRGSQSDVFRYEIIERFGGIYLDTDFYQIKSFDELLKLEFFSGNGSDFPEVFNGLFGSVPNHVILNNIIDDLTNLQPNLVQSIQDIMNKTGPYLFANKVFDYLQSNENSNAVILPKEYFYSLPADNRFHLRNINYDKNYIEGHINNKSFCIHLWENSWQ